MELIEKWQVQDAIETYGVRHWGKGYFGVNRAGHVTVHPNKRPDQSIDLKDLVDQLQARLDVAAPRLGDVESLKQLPAGDPEQVRHRARVPECDQR